MTAYSTMSFFCLVGYNPVNGPSYEVCGISTLRLVYYTYDQHLISTRYLS